MNGVFHDVDAAKMGAVVVAQEFVVIAGNVDDPGALARLAQHFLHEVIVRLRPGPIGLQGPTVNDITDQINGFGIMAAQKIQQSFGLRAAGAKVNIGDEQRAIAPFGTLFSHRIPMR
jgi:hypothetical protein